MGNWLVMFGLVVELSGIGLAVWGVVGVGDELFPGLRFPHRPVVRRLRRAFGWKPTDHHLEVQDSVHIVSPGRARAQGMRGRPAEDAPLAEWNLYWESRLNNLGARLDWMTEDMQEADAANASRIARLAERFETAVPRLEERLRVVVGGERGRGLVRTWWGLIAIGAGAILQVAGGLIG